MGEPRAGGECRPGELLHIYYLLTTATLSPVRSRGAGRDQGGGGVPVPAQPLRPGRRVQGGQRQLRQPPAHLHLPVSVTCVIITRVTRVNIVTDAGTEVTPWCGAAAGSVSATPSAPPTSPASTTGARTPARAQTHPAGTTPTARWISTLHYLHYLHHLQGVRFVMI